MRHDRPGLAWICLSAIGGALAALIVAGIVAGRLGIAITAPLLLAAAAIGTLPRLVALLRWRWAAQVPELALALLVFTAISALVLWLAWPSLLPLGRSVDAVHQFQLVNWIAVEHRLPPLDARTQGLMGEMIAYSPGFAFVVAAASALFGAPTLETLYPTVALLGGLCAALMTLLAVRSAGVAGWRIVLLGLSVLLLLLAHRAYFLEAYIDSSYYAQVLGLLLVLLACAWPICEPRISLLGAGQLGLVLAALLATYPLWVPVPLLFICLALVQQPAANSQYLEGTPRPNAIQQREHGLPFLRNAVMRQTLPRLLLTLGPLALLAAVDLPARLGTGQVVLEHQGVVTAPSLFGLLPLLLAIPAAALLIGSGRRSTGKGQGSEASLFSDVVAVHMLQIPALIVALGCAGLTWAALVLAAQLGLVAQYHSVKILFLLVPLAIALTGAGLIRLAALERPFVRAVALLGCAVVLGLASARFMLPLRVEQIPTRNMVAAARWLLANNPGAAEKAIAVGTPIGPDSYWLQVALLGQWRDEAQQAMRSFTLAPPTPEGWAIDPNLPDTVVAANLGITPPGSEVLQQFGEVAVLRRKPLDLAAVNPLILRYASHWEDNQLKTALELIRPNAGPLPQIALQLVHAETLVAQFDLAANQQRTRNQYLGVDIDPATLGGSGYVNAEAFPTFAAPPAAPSGEYQLVLSLSVDQRVVDQRLLATFDRQPAGTFTNLAVHSGELDYLRRSYDQVALETHAARFGTAVSLTGWQATSEAANNTLVTTLRWQSLIANQAPLDLALRLVDATGATVAENRSAPQQGFYPSWRWRVGEDVTEQRTLTLPSTIPPGSYTLAIAVYDQQGELALTAGERQLGQVNIAR